MRNVEKKSILYEVFRLYAMIISRLSHRYITVNGLENVPQNEPVILAPNHQNGLYDSLEIVLNSFFKPVFLARADIFKKKIISRMLNFIGMTPVYRIRDGKDSLNKNKAVFDNSLRILKNNRMICIYPEAAHSGIKSMIPHKKAIPRIVFMAAADTNFDIDVNIIPMGINYTHYYNFRRSVTVNFGKPIHSKDYYKLLQEEGEIKATNVLRKDLFEAIRKLIVHVPDKKNYDLFEQAFELMKTAAYDKLGIKNTLKNFVDAEQYLTEKIEEKYISNIETKNEWNLKAQKYKVLKEKLHLSEDELSKDKIGVLEGIKILLISVLLAPIGLYGTISTGWFFYLSNYSYRNIIKDKLFYSTFSFSLNFIFYPFWLIGQFLILILIFKSWLIAIGLVVFSFPSGIVAWELGQLIRRSVRRIKMRKMVANDNKQFHQLNTLRNELISYYQSILD